eukprot:768398-Hanusia_phi.AAC.8
MLRSKVASSEGAAGTQGKGASTVSFGRGDLASGLTIGGKKPKILVDRDGAMVNLDFARFGQQTYNHSWSISTQVLAHSSCTRDKLAAEKFLEGRVLGAQLSKPQQLRQGRAMMMTTTKMMAMASMLMLMLMLRRMITLMMEWMIRSHCFHSSPLLVRCYLLGVEMMFTGKLTERMKKIS